MDTSDKRLNKIDVQRGWILGFIAAVGMVTGSGWLSLEHLLQVLGR